jgi:hypothetical protein
MIDDGETVVQRGLVRPSREDSSETPPPPQSVRPES